MEADNQEVEAEFDGGWVKVYRQLENERVFHDPHLWQLYCYLLFKARHQPGAVSLQVAGNTTTVKLEVGQLIVGRNRLGEELNCNPTTAWDRLKRLEGFGMITVESDSHKSVVSIVNYQGSQYVEPVDVDKQVTAKRQPVGKRLTSSRQPSDTNREGIQLEKVENESIKGENKTPLPPKGEPKPKGTIGEWDIPDGFDTPEVRQALTDFEAMRASIGKKIKSRANVSKSLKGYDSPAHLVYAIEFAIGNEYQGIKPDYRPGNAGQGAKYLPPKPKKSNLPVVDENWEPA
jgi:hypothetical protein